MKEIFLRVEERVAALPQGLQAHINRVCNIAAELAPHHGLDPERARLGALAHDVARAMSDQELVSQAERLDVPISLVTRKVPLLLHGPVGAELLRVDDDVKDHSLHQTVYWHTTAHPSLDALGKVVFLADKLDPQKLQRYPYQPQLMELAREDLDRAVLEYLSREIVALATRGQMVHPAMVEARNSLLASRVEGQA